MISTLTSRRSFTARLASLFAGVGVAGAISGSNANAQAPAGVQKLDYEGKPATGGGFITPLIIHSGVIYIAGQGAHSHDPKGEFPMEIEIHTKKVMDNVKTLVESGGGTLCGTSTAIVLAHDVHNAARAPRFGQPVARLPGQYLLGVRQLAGRASSASLGDEAISVACQVSRGRARR